MEKTRIQIGDEVFEDRYGYWCKPGVSDEEVKRDIEQIPRGYVGVMRFLIKGQYGCVYSCFLSLLNRNNAFHKEIRINDVLLESKTLPLLVRNYFYINSYPEHIAKILLDLNEAIKSKTIDLVYQFEDDAVSKWLKDYFRESRNSRNKAAKEKKIKKQYCLKQ